jgi:hypothetical protein
MMTADLVAVALTFVDALGNPIPAETQINIVGQYAGPNDTVIASGYAGEPAGFTAYLAPGQTYRASFVGNRMKYVDATGTVQSVGVVFFVAEVGDVTVTIPGYASPAKSQLGFATEILSDITRGMLGDTPVFGTIVALTLASMIATVQQNISTLRANIPLVSCVGSAIDSWARDFFGNTLPRYLTEPDAAYIARIIENLDPYNCTLAAIQSRTTAYLQLQATYGTEPTLALDQSGSLDGYGALDNAGTVAIVPAVLAFDRQSDPARSALVNLQPGQVCILLSYPGLSQQGFILGQASLGNSALLSPAIQVTSAPNTSVDQYIRDNVEAAGFDLVWADNRTA